MIFQEPEVMDWIVGGVIAMIIVYLIFIIFMASRYRKFKINQFVIHLWHGAIKHEGIGGSLWLLPLIDDYIVIPLTRIQTSLKIIIQAISRQYKDIQIIGTIIWKVVDPQKCVNEISWDIKDKNYAENILKKTINAIIKKICYKMTPEEILKEREKNTNIIIERLTKLTSEWGILIETFEIYDVYFIKDISDKQIIGIKV